MFSSKKLLKHKKISHGFFNKNGGKSEGIYKSLNSGSGSNDKKKRIKENLKIVKNKISKKSKKIFLLHQVHSNKFVFVDKSFKLNKKNMKADAVITNQKKLPIAVLTADCVPILLYDDKKDIIAAIHAGWKGSFKGIVKKVINFMLSKGCKNNSIIAAIGPCIRQGNYNVREDFKKKFIKKDKRNKFFLKRKKIHFILIYLNLLNLNLNQIKLQILTC